MKRYNVVLILCILLFFCSCGEKNEDIQGNNGTLSIFIEDYELQIPCDWMIKSVYSYQKADQPVLQVDVLDFDEEQLKQEYGYQSKEECLVHFMPNGVYEQERKEAEAADHLKGWQLKCTADRYSEEEGAFVVSDEPVYLDFLVDDEKERYGRRERNHFLFTEYERKWSTGIRGWNVSLDD